ncbi:MAG: hypothetical protein CVV41_00155 [Candidatus Riflebacteria bacterium HGW-Riflebacteria-1]|jgi:uncharacterized integral membrane protein|nr:MAG: hypothetical protein CVV41_00155 [Candidatus Riflebacteria bacterium HGW-Riflebacteria-1]
MLGTVEVFVVAYLLILLLLVIIAYATLKAAFTLTAGINEVIKGLAAVESRLARLEQKQD